MSIGNTLDVVVVSPNAFHSGSRIASSAASTSGNAAGSTAGHGRVDGDELDGRHAVLRRQHADDVVGRVGRRFQAGEDALVGRREQRDAVAPALRERQLVERDGIGGRLGALGGEHVGHGRTPSSSSACG